MPEARSLKPVARDQAGYTLIEIMGVIAIMGILMSILIYGLGGFRRKAFEEGSRATVQSLKAAIDAYYNTYRVYPPDGFDTPVFRQSSGARAQIKGGQCLIYYLGFPTVQETEVGSEVRVQELRPFLELSGEMLSGEADFDTRLNDPQTLLVDRFGNAIHYDSVARDPATPGNYLINEQSAAIVYQGTTVTAPDPRRPRGSGSGGGGLASRNKGTYDIWSNGLNPEDPNDDITNWK